jgi:hypothetical protein
VTPGFIQRLQRETETAAAAEADYRREAEGRIEELACRRIYSHRRLNLLRAMTRTAEAEQDPALAVEAQIDLACAESGWTDAHSAYGEMRRRLTPVAEAVAGAARRETADAASDPIACFADFEAWYRERFKADFLALLERQQGSNFSPVVDF